MRGSLSAPVGLELGFVSPWEGRVVWLEEAGSEVCVWVPRGVCKGDESRCVCV